LRQRTSRECALSPFWGCWMYRSSCLCKRICKYVQLTMYGPCAPVYPTMYSPCAPVYPTMYTTCALVHPTMYAACAPVHPTMYTTCALLHPTMYATCASVHPTMYTTGAPVHRVRPSNIFISTYFNDHPVQHAYFFSNISRLLSIRSTL
jgi:hypothetical protein